MRLLQISLALLLVLGAAVIPVSSQAQPVVVTKPAGMRPVLPEMSPDSVFGEFTGLYRGGFELSQFRPCPGSVKDSTLANQLEGKRIWLEVTEEAAERYRARVPPPTDTIIVNQGEGPWFHVRVKGMLTGPGYYGHLGASDYELRVEEILDPGTPPAACPAPPVARKRP